MCVLLAAMAVLPCTAQDVGQAGVPQASTEAVDELLSLLDLRSLLERTRVQVTQSLEREMAAGTRNQALSDADQLSISRYEYKIEQLLKEELGWERMQPVYEQIYRENFTDGEVRELIAMYRSPAGLLLLKKMPAVTQQSIELGMSRVKELMPRIQEYAASQQQEIQSNHRPAIVPPAK